MDAAWFYFCGDWRVQLAGLKHMLTSRQVELRELFGLTGILSCDISTYTTAYF